MLVPLPAGRVLEKELGLSPFRIESRNATKVSTKTGVMTRKEYLSPTMSNRMYGCPVKLYHLQSK